MSDMRLIGGVAAGVLGGLLLSTLLHEETSGDRIVAAARERQAPAIIFIGSDGNVHARDRESGDPIRDCTTGGCKTDVVIGPFREPQLINKATGQAVDPAKIIIRREILAWHFTLSPGCWRFWPGGEVGDC